MRRIAVVTSGGDAPGMNAAIRSVVRLAFSRGCQVFGVLRGFAGLVNGELRPLGPRDVGEIMHRGGTVLGSSRAPEFRTEAGREKALGRLRQHEVEGLVVIGGNGSQSGAYALSRLGFPVAGVASTIDNDLYGFERTLGVDTALNVALEAIDRLRTTATSLERAFLVEVMGRDHGYLALMAGLAGGAEAILLPEVEKDPDELAAEIRAAYDRGKPHAIVVVAEGAAMDGEELERYFREHDLGFELRLTKLGHVQRGAAPTIADRLLGLQSGYEATRRLLAGEHGFVAGLRGGRIETLPLELVATRKKELDLALLEVASVLAT